jgi:hypothetical protein
LKSGAQIVVLSTARLGWGIWLCCGLLTLEYLSGGAWRAVGQCSQPRPVKVVEIAAGADTPQSIGFSQNMDMGVGWSAGTYRLSLSYAPNQSQANTSGATTVHSDTFAVG